VRGQRRILLWAGAAAALGLSACDLLLGFSDTQCSTDDDCRGHAAGEVCVRGICQAGSQDASAAIEASTMMDAGTDMDASMPMEAAALGPPGCFSGTPATDFEFFNRCTNSQYLAYDNCAHLALCDGAAPPVAKAPPPPDSGTSDASVNLPSVYCYGSTPYRPIYMQGGTNFTPFVKAMAPIVAQNNYTIVWQPTSSCAAAGAAGFAASPANLMKNPTSPSQSPAAYYDVMGNATPCLLGAGDPNAPDSNSEPTDVGESDLFSTTCNSSWLTQMFPNVGEYLGPIASYLFVTPPGSSQRVISAEAAHVVFGLGGDNGLSVPWVNPSDMWIRSSSTGTNNILSLAIGVPAKGWWGTVLPTAAAMQTTILTTSQSSAEPTIGTLSIDYADSVKNSLHILYFQASGQLVGFLPDSSPATSDKQNVRDGHYAPWGPIHLFAPVTGGHPSAAAEAFIQPFAVPNQQLVDATIAGGAVPQCAMYVQRTAEMGPLSAYSPSFQCYCYYDFKVTGATSCQSCMGAAQCPSNKPACNLGFCEVQ
jgi:hypothetical protein